MTWSRRLANFWLPITLVIVYTLTVFLLRDVLPSADDITSNFTQFFAKYGYEIVFVGAFLEGALIIDLLIPGGSVVLAGAYFSSIGLLSYPVFLLVSVAGFSLGFFLDYLVGYYGWSDVLKRIGLGRQLDKAKEKVKRWEGRSFLLGYIHPDSATLVAVSAGMIKMDIKRFTVYNILATFIWVSVWTGLVYLFGPVIASFFEGSFAYIIVIMLIISVVLGWMAMRKGRGRRRNVYSKVHNY